MKHRISLLAAAALLLCLPSCRFIRISDELREPHPDSGAVLDADSPDMIPETDISEIIDTTAL